MNQDKIIGQNLKKYREGMGLSQSNLSQYLGVTREEVSYFENGRRTMSTKLISKVSKLLGIDEYDLFEEDGGLVDVKVALAFRANSVDIEDLESIADFRRIALNYLKMTNALAQ